MIKKRNEDGFALVYVVVVIFILCSIAIALMSHTLNTLQAQQKMIERMQHKYEAQGEIERLVAELESTLDELDPDGTGITGDGKARDAKKDFSNILKNLGLIENVSDDVVDNITKDLENYVKISDDTEPSQIFKRSLPISHSVEEMSVQASLDIIFEVNVTESLEYQKNPDGSLVLGADGQPIQTGISSKYNLKVLELDFSSYEITAGGDS